MSFFFLVTHGSADQKLKNHSTSVLTVPVSPLILPVLSGGMGELISKAQFQMEAGCLNDSQIVRYIKSMLTMFRQAQFC